MDIDLYDRLTAVLFRMECVAQAMYAMYDCQRRDDYAADLFAPGTFVLHDYLDRLTSEMRSILKEEMKEL